jgi:hypothetical protein
MRRLRRIQGFSDGRMEESMKNFFHGPFAPPRGMAQSVKNFSHAAGGNKIFLPHAGMTRKKRKCNSMAGAFFIGNLFRKRQFVCRVKRK